MNFFKVFLASLLGVVTAFLLFLVVLFIIVGFFAASFSLEEEVSGISENSVLELNLNKLIVDKSSPYEEELSRLFDLNFNKIEIRRIVETIKRAKLDQRIKGISLRAGYPLAGWTQTSSIRDALEDFKGSGKFVYAYDEFYTQKGYYLSSVADTIVAHPMGSFSFKGLVSEVLYYKDIQDKYGIRLDIIRNGKYKSAGEPFLSDRMSPENREQIAQLLNTFWTDIRGDIASSRKLDEKAIDRIANNLEVAVVEDAVDTGLLDLLVDENDFENLIKESLSIGESHKLKTVNLREARSLKQVGDRDSQNRIAIVYAQGPIIYGTGTENIVGHKTMSNTLEKLAKKESIKAIVLRINSPGGSAFASEMIWKSIEKISQEKPVVTSMGDVAASGGYYIATGSDKIFADPKTITGSIGVVFAVPNMKDFMDDIGINAEHVVTHDNALDYSIYEGIQPGFRQVQFKEMNKVYDTFKKRVSEGRNINIEEVEEIAQGRVWSGDEALENGLIDGLGDLDYAIQQAADLADVSSYSVVEYPKWDDEFGNFLESLISSAGNVLKSERLEMFGIEPFVLDEIKKIDDLSGMQTVLPLHLNIK